MYRFYIRFFGVYILDICNVCFLYFNLYFEDFYVFICMWFMDYYVECVYGYSMEMLVGFDGELLDKLKNLEFCFFEYVSNEIMD